VRKHHSHHAIRLDDPTALGEDRGHPLLVVASSELFPPGLLAFELGRIGHGLAVFVGQMVSKLFRK
jgi:hypothetical protein